MPHDGSRALLLEHANAITLDPSRPRADAVLCRNGFIEAIGTNEELDGLLGEDDVRFDCGELTLAPAFFDSHTHFMAMGLATLRVDLSAVPDRDSLLAALRERAEGTVEGEWVIGQDFDETAWDGGRDLPTREELDREVSDAHPVVARRVCGHVAAANSMALERIGDGWEMVDGDTGLLLEDVVLRLSEVVGVSDRQARLAVMAATRRAYAEGVTSVVDMADLRTLRTYQELAEEGRLGVRVFCAVQARDLFSPGAAGSKVDRAPSGPMLRFVGVKAFLDGSIGARTAAMSVPYADDPDDGGNRGLLLYTDEELRSMVRRAEARGYQLFMHAIGDRAVGQALDAIEEEAAPGNPLRHRLEHMECATAEQLDRVKALRIVASMQPNFVTQWSGPGRMNEVRLGANKARTVNALRDVWGRGIPLAFGSDCMPFGPLYGLEGAVHHQVEEQSLPPVVALRAYSTMSAWAVHAEDLLGTLEVGKAADMVLLDRDPEHVGDLRDLQVVLTVLGGEVVYADSEAFEEALSREAYRALEEALGDADLPSLDLEGPMDEDEDEDEDRRD